MPTSALLRMAFRVAALALSSGPIAAAQAETVIERTNRGLVEMITTGDSAAVAMAQDMAGVINDGATRRLLPVIGGGALQDLIDLTALRGVDIGIIQTDVLGYARKNKLIPGIEHAVTYIAKLHDEELHILARSEIAAVEDLAGKKVDFVGGAAVTGPAVLKLLGVDVEAVLESRSDALAKLKSGEVAAMAYVAAKPASVFSTVGEADGLHFLSIPLTPKVSAAYVPARLTSEDYPRLVPAGTPIDTVAVGMALMVAKLPPSTERYGNIANFVDAFFTQFPRLQQAPHQAKWADVNLAAELPGWKRFPPADAWLKRNVVAAAPAIDEQELHEIFAKFLDERSRLAGGRLMSAQEKDRLFDQFRRWQVETR